ncbi:MAG: hypothetical protein AMS25_16895 [Gemmatimonas sp. SM23_52]|nr:MAG: hypothetical protein AMS25_16895 [Gemmatimonas sp. SM23_52]
MLAGAAEVLGDARFMLMIVVYSVFWILYFQTFGSMLWYLRDVIDKEPVSTAVTSLLRGIGLPITFRFDIEHVTAINAGTIVLLQVVVSRIVANRKALPTMVAGMLLGALGFVLLALCGFNPWIFIAGISIFSIGEMTAHPKYYSFIGLVAPQDRKAVYMGYAFLYGVFGSLLGSNLGAFMYARMLEPILATAGVTGKATVFWLIFAVLDVFAAAALVMFVAFLVLGLTADPVQIKTVVQALIFLALGLGGIIINRRGLRSAA